MLHDQALTPLFTYVARAERPHRVRASDRGADDRGVAAPCPLAPTGTVDIDDVFSGDTRGRRWRRPPCGAVGVAASNEFKRVLPERLDLTLRTCRAAGEHDDRTRLARHDANRRPARRTPCRCMLRDYRGDTETVSMPVTMPAQASGPLTLLVSDAPTLTAARTARAQTRQAGELAGAARADEHDSPQQPPLRPADFVERRHRRGRRDAARPPGVGALDPRRGQDRRNRPSRKSVVGAWDQRLDRARSWLARTDDHALTCTLIPDLIACVYVPLLAVCAMLAAISRRRSAASGPTFWTVATAADFLRGTSDGVFVSQQGRRLTRARC